ncbi:cell division protein ZapA [Alicyclobacillus acidiphilus]|uniref:cell division protein ZapA n=1 Tax=Alicyclobacillus acidiphilus TaxID=182455 RepID=UPI000831D0E2|nr:cell division protein ZapA [Alicyclobacillus acidiphilus]
MDDQSINRVKVVIHGVEYTIRGSASERHIHEVARLVDQRMSEIAASSAYMDERRVAVLTAVNLADELHRLRQEYEELLAMLDERTRGETST